MDLEKIRSRIEKGLGKEVMLESLDKGSDILFIVKSDKKDLIGKQTASKNFTDRH